MDYHLKIVEEEPASLHPYQESVLVDGLE